MTLKLVLSPFTICLKPVKVTVWLLDRGWAHMLCAGHGKPLSAQVESGLKLQIGMEISLWRSMWFRAMKTVKEVELQLFALMLRLSFATISTKINQRGHLFFCWFLWFLALTRLIQGTSRY